MASKSEETLGFLKNALFWLFFFFVCLLHVLQVQNSLSVGLRPQMGFRDQKWVR